MPSFYHDESKLPYPYFMGADDGNEEIREDKGDEENSFFNIKAVFLFQFSESLRKMWGSFS